MTLDNTAGKWAIWCGVAAIIATLIHVSTFFLPGWDRGIRICFGIITASTICFCGFLQLVKQSPNWFRKRFQGIFDNGHPWIGLFGAWCVILHTKFRIPMFLTTSTVLYLAFFAVIICGVVNFYFHNLQVIMKDTKGSAKKERAGLLLRLGKTTSDSLHFGLHFSLYFFLLCHVHMYLFYNIRGFF